MKKHYHKGAIHPSPPPSLPISFSYLPAAILTLVATLSAEDKEVLSYLLSCSAASATDMDFSLPHNKPHHHHTPSCTCYCFTCYTSFWVRWDSSPNRQVIHDIIDSLEDGYSAKGKKREKRRNNKKNRGSKVNDGSVGPGRVNHELGRVESEKENGGEVGKGGGEAGEKQGNVRKIVSFIGDRIWGSVWG